MRTEIMTLLRAFPRLQMDRINRFFGEDVSAYVDALEADGLLRSERAPSRGRGRPARTVMPAQAAGEVVPVATALSVENARARAQVSRWVVDLAALRDGRGASAAASRHASAALLMLAEAYRAPHRYGRETPLSRLVEAVGGAAGDRAWMRAARLLNERGVIDLFERKGLGRVTTLQLREPPPYPMA